MSDDRWTDDRWNGVRAPVVREACFVALREGGYPMTAKEVVAIIEPTIGVEVERGGEIHRYMPYEQVFRALQALERSDVVCSQKIHTSRLWWARG